MMILDWTNGFLQSLLAGLAVAFIIYLVNSIRKKIKSNKEAKHNRVTFSLNVNGGSFKNLITLTNTSEVSVYNLQVEPPSNLFWDFDYTPVKELEPNESVDMTFSKVLAPQKDWYLMLKWTDEDGKNKQKRKIELKF